MFVLNTDTRDKSSVVVVVQARNACCEEVGCVLLAAYERYAGAFIRVEPSVPLNAIRTIHTTQLRRLMNARGKLIKIFELFFLIN